MDDRLLLKERIEALLEESITEAIEIGGRTNSVDLLDSAARMLAGEMPLSPALAAWFRAAVDRIGHGESADVAFGSKRKQGETKSLLESRTQSIEILRRVDAAREQGYLTGDNNNASSKGSCFEFVAGEMDLPEAFVRKAYYKWKTAEHLAWEARIDAE